MGIPRKVTVRVSRGLLARALRSSGVGLTETVRIGLQLVAASEACANLRADRGKVRLSRSMHELKEDR